MQAKYVTHNNVDPGLSYNISVVNLFPFSQKDFKYFLYTKFFIKLVLVDVPDL